MAGGLMHFIVGRKTVIPFLWRKADYFVKRAASSIILIKFGISYKV